MSNTVILIPSRLAATRLPNKPLLKINNISIINHVYKIAKSSLIGESYVATGDKEIFEEVTKLGGNCIFTKKDHKTGTDRIFEAYQELRDENIEYVINLQGDEPMLDIEDVHNLLKKTIEKKSKISTLACQIKDEKFFLNKNIVKVTTKEELNQNNLSTASSFTREIENTQKNLTPKDRNFIESLKKYKKKILFCATSDVPDCLIKSIKISQKNKNWLWMIRLHPRHSSYKKLIEKLIKENISLKNIQIKNPSKLNLQFMINKSSHVLIDQSSVVLDAAYQKKPVICLTNQKSLFSSWDNLKVCNFSSNPSKIISLIKEVNTNRCSNAINYEGRDFACLKKFFSN